MKNNKQHKKTQVKNKTKNLKQFLSTNISMVNSASHFSDIDKMSTRNFWELLKVVQSKLPPHSGFVALKQLNSMHKKEP